MTEQPSPSPSTPHAPPPSPVDTGSAGATPPPTTRPPPPFDLRPGARPVPDHELICKLGAGAAGQVWKARKPNGFEVALKFLRHVEHAGAAEVRELSLMKNVRHPHVLPLNDTWQRGVWLIVSLELAECSLLDRLREPKPPGQDGIPLEKLKEYLREAAKGLDYLHGKGIQHRDVKPANLLLVGDSVKVADFGLAKLLAATLADNTERNPTGTPAFAAPEVWECQTSIHSDQYALAISYCQLRGGRLPFQGSIAELCYVHCHGSADLSMLPTEREREAVARGLAKRPEERWPSCRALALAITGETASSSAISTDQSAADQSAAAPSVRLPAPAPDWPSLPQPRLPRPWRRIAAIVLLLPLVGVLATGVWLHYNGKNRVAAAPSRSLGSPTAIQSKDLHFPMKT